MLDNASGDGSAGAARRHPATTELVALDAPARQGRERLRPVAARSRPLLPPAQRGLGAARRVDGDPARGARGAPRRGGGWRGAAAPRRPPADRRRGAFRRRRRRSSARSSCTAATPCRAGARRCATSTGRSPPRCSCGAKPPSRSAGSIRRSSSTPTRSTSASGCAMRAGARCTCRARRPSTTSSSRRGAVPERRIVELSRNRDLYMRKHHSHAAGVGRAAAHSVHLCGARARRARAAAPRRAPLLAPCDRDAAARARRRAARGRARAQPRPAPVGSRRQLLQHRERRRHRGGREDIG